MAIGGPRAKGETGETILQKEVALKNEHGFPFVRKRCCVFSIS